MSTWQFKSNQHRLCNNQLFAHHHHIFRLLMIFTDLGVSCSTADLHHNQNICHHRHHGDHGHHEYCPLTWMMFGQLVAAGRLGASCPGRWPAWSLQGSGNDSGKNDGDGDGGWNCWSCWIMLIVVTWLRVYLQSTAWVLIKGTRLCTALGFVKISILLCEISCGFVKFEWKLDPVYSAWLTKSVT